MREVDELKRAVIAEVDRLADRLWEVAESIGRTPEIGHQEHYAITRLTELLAAGGIDSETNVYGVPTAFEANIGPNRRPRVAILATYDALQDLGHGCGHHVVGAAAVGAGLALVSMMEYLPGSVVVLGAPVEQRTGNGANGMEHMVRAGALNLVDACLMFHPSDHTFLDSGIGPGLVIARAFRRNLEMIGLDVLDARPESAVDLTDLENVRFRVPTVVAGISIAEPGVPRQSGAFAEAALSEKAHGALIAAAKGLAMTAIDLLADPSLLSEAAGESDGDDLHVIVP